MPSPEISSPPSTADPLVFTIKADLRKFDTRADIEPFLKPLIENPDVEEIHLSGNTYGVEACEYLGEVLATKKKLKVLLLHPTELVCLSLRALKRVFNGISDLYSRSPNLQISSLPVFEQRSLNH